MIMLSFEMMFRRYDDYEIATTVSAYLFRPRYTIRLIVLKGGNSVTDQYEVSLYFSLT